VRGGSPQSVTKGNDTPNNASMKHSIGRKIEFYEAEGSSFGLLNRGGKNGRIKGKKKPES